MQPLKPIVQKLILPSKRNQQWKFTKKMKSEFINNPAGRIWWVNTNTKTKTNVTDTCTDPDAATSHPPGLHVFKPLVTQQTLDCVVHEFEQLFQEERRIRTVPYYSMTGYNNIEILFSTSNPTDRQMTLQETMTSLRNRAPAAAKLTEILCNSVQSLLGMTQSEMESLCIIGILKYAPYSGIHAHIDNIVRTGNSTGPLFTMSLGGNGGPKQMDMFPVIEHWRAPVRISTPVGSVIMIDGVARIEWSHAIPEGDPSNRWTIMLNLKQISNRRVKFSKTLQMHIYESKLSIENTEEPAGPCESTQNTESSEKESPLIS